jgi:hypothetical protein
MKKTGQEAGLCGRNDSKPCSHGKDRFDSATVFLFYENVIGTEKDLPPAVCL